MMYYPPRRRYINAFHFQCLELGVTQTTTCERIHKYEPFRLRSSRSKPDLLLQVLLCHRNLSTQHVTIVCSRNTRISIREYRRLMPRGRIKVHAIGSDELNLPVLVECRKTLRRVCHYIYHSVSQYLISLRRTLSSCCYLRALTHSSESELHVPYLTHRKFPRTLFYALQCSDLNLRLNFAT